MARTNPPETDSGARGRLKEEAGGLLNALADRALSAARDKVQDATGRLTDYVEGDGGPGLMAAVTGAKGLAEGKGPVRSMLGAGVSGLKEKVSGMLGGKGKSASKRKLKFTNIVESIDVGVPISVAYNQWTQFEDFPTFTKKVESVDRSKEEEQKLNWKAQVFWSHRTWEASIIDQHPEERIVWRSKGQKGHVDGAVTFHELGPSLTRIVVILEYHPQGMFEHTANLWRAQGRRARLELKHFARHVMLNSVLNADDIEGWRGVIEDGEVVTDHETAMQDESGEQGREPGQDEDTAEETEQPAAEAEEEEFAAEAEEEPEDAEDVNGESPRRRPEPARAARGRRAASVPPPRRTATTAQGRRN